MTGVQTCALPICGGILLGLLVNSVHIIVSGIGITLSAIFSYLMFHVLYDVKGMDVIEDPPNKVFLVCLRNSMILTAIFWVIFLVLFPIVPGGGGDSKRSRSSSSRSSSRSSSSSRRRRGHVRFRRPIDQQILHVRTYEGYPNAVSDEMIKKTIVEAEWAEIGMHDPKEWVYPAWVYPTKDSKEPYIWNRPIEIYNGKGKKLPKGAVQKIWDEIREKNQT